MPVVTVAGGGHWPKQVKFPSFSLQLKGSLNIVVWEYSFILHGFRDGEGTNTPLVPLLVLHATAALEDDLHRWSWPHMLKTPPMPTYLVQAAPRSRPSSPQCTSRHKWQPNPSTPRHTPNCTHPPRKTPKQATLHRRPGPSNLPHVSGRKSGRLACEGGRKGHLPTPVLMMSLASPEVPWPRAEFNHGAVLPKRGAAHAVQTAGSPRRLQSRSQGAGA